MATELEANWSNTAPTVDGVYWWRFGADDDEPEAHRVIAGVGYYAGTDPPEPIGNYDGEWLGPISPSDFEQLVRLRDEVVSLRVDQRAVRKLYDLSDEGDFYEQMADHLEYDTVDKVRLQNAVWNLLTETFYEEGLKNNGVAVRFLMRLHLLAHEAGLPEYSKDNPIVAQALAALGDPAENSPESLAAAALRNALGTKEGE